MSDKPKIIAMIPARKGSTRLKMKNLALLDGKPLISYAIQAAQESNVFDRIVVNSEDDMFATIAQKYEVEFYKRPAHLATSEAKSDDVIHDFMNNNPSDIVAWVNPTSPLQTGEEVRNVIEHFVQEDLDSLITVKNEQVHSNFAGKALNYNKEELFARTQDLEPVQYFVYSIMMWRAEAFQKEYLAKGHALLCGKLGFYPVSKLTSIIIKKEEDLKMAEYFLAGRRACTQYSVEYDQEVVS